MQYSIFYFSLFLVVKPIKYLKFSTIWVHSRIIGQLYKINRTEGKRLVELRSWSFSFCMCLIHYIERCFRWFFGSRIVLLIWMLFLIGFVHRLSILVNIFWTITFLLKFVGGKNIENVGFATEAWRSIYSGKYYFFNVKYYEKKWCRRSLFKHSVNVASTRIMFLKKCQDIK